MLGDDLYNLSRDDGTARIHGLIKSCESARMDEIPVLSDASRAIRRASIGQMPAGLCQRYHSLPTIDRLELCLTMYLRLKGIN